MEVKLQPLHLSSSVRGGDNGRGTFACSAKTEKGRKGGEEEEGEESLNAKCSSCICGPLR